MDRFVVGDEDYCLFFFYVESLEYLISLNL